MRHREPEDSAIPLPGPPGVAELSRLPRRAYSFEVIPEAASLEAARADLNLLGLRKVRLTGRIDPLDGRDWTLAGHLGATVSQPCVVTTQPVTTRLEEDLERRYLANWEEPAAGSDIEMPDDENIEPLPRSLDLMALLHEALVLALPLYPRAEDAAFDGASLSEPGVAPLSDEDVKPFAGLAGLRDRLSGPDTGAKPGDEDDDSGS